MEDYTQKTDSFDETIEHAEKVIDQLDELIDTHAAAPTTAAVPTTQAPTSGLPNGHVSQNISLPKAQLLSFAGELRDWARFNQFFEAMVHRNASLSDIQKLDYLFKALEGSTRECGQGFALSADNCTICRDRLKSRFANKELLQKRLISNLQRLQCSGQSLSDSHRFIDKAEAILAIQMADAKIAFQGFEQVVELLDVGK
ncbi:hypothetical protein L596_023743 [Steinernema carpocapsae]|uniref:Uncharacterized protein n=1 Tax=Steinernema carpocapsae TaxID=34508 RepID=A0A4U5MEK0_STECR|nr:hypothetical protein L596_023743 [Steinernema carpocapsae]